MHDGAGRASQSKVKDHSKKNKPGPVEGEIMSRSTALRLTRILAGRSKEELKEAALAAAARLGFPYLLFSGSFSQREIGGEIRFDNVPEEWHRQCGGRTRDLLPASLRRQ